MFPTLSFRKRRLDGAARFIVFLLAVGAGISRSPAEGSGVVFTNIAQFRSAPPEVFLGHCVFQLSGVVTLADTNRDLLVLQNESGAVALNPAAGLHALGVQVGERVSLEGSGCSPCFVGFPKYPYCPTTNEVRDSFEAPTGLGEYYLTRMRGYLHPPVTGEYTFWIASDNSSQLWLSSNDDPRKAKRIAFITRYNWVEPREWSHFPSQRSETIFLKAGQSYYIEALQEQTSGNEHLAVAWQGPSQKQAVIDGQFLTPWIDPDNPAPGAATNGILREFWRNFASGDLDTLSSPRPFDSILSVEKLKVTARATADMPEPLPITLNQQLRPEEKFNWVEAQGEVTFAGQDDRGGFLELSDDEAQVQVRVLCGDAEALQGIRNSIVRVTGVCEAVYDPKNVLVPGAIWAAQDDCISVIEGAKGNLNSSGQSSGLILTNGNVPMGFYNAHGVVTFNDRVFGNDIMFVQEDGAAVFASMKGVEDFASRYEVGRWVELGGASSPGKNIPLLSPLTIMELGWRPLPTPLPQPVQSPVPGNRDGRWTEVEGVVHAVHPNGTLTLSDSGGLLSVWIGKLAPDALKRFVDARVRLRGVLSLSIQESPLLLVPSAKFLYVEEEAPGNPFALASCSVSNVFAGDADRALSHRVKLKGNVTLSGERSFVMQDGLAGVRVESVDRGEMSLGQAVEVVGFPMVNGSTHILTSALVRPTGAVQEVAPHKLDAGDGISFRHSGSLVQVSANLIAQRKKSGRQLLELQEKQRVFEAELPFDQPELPPFEPGSRLQLSGVADFVPLAGLPSGGAAESPSTGALKIWLRHPADVVLLSGPPWWSWKYTTLLVGSLLMVVVLSLLRNQLLHRRLERHLELSRQILESQESERHRIAANLHDSLGQNLLVIKNQAHLAMQPAEESVRRHRLDEISECASEAIAEVREITYALRPYQLDRLGLTQTIRATVNRAAENSPILFASHADDVDGVFDKESEIHVYRIVQEAVNNILKHSGATEATVVVKKLAAMVSLSIRDNGRGFDAVAMQHSESPDVGHGLSGIKERTRILGGTFTIDSRAGHGATLSIEIPISVSNHAAK